MTTWTNRTPTSRVKCKPSDHERPKEKPVLKNVKNKRKSSLWNRFPLYQLKHAQLLHINRRATALCPWNMYLLHFLVCNYVLTTNPLFTTRYYIALRARIFDEINVRWELPHNNITYRLAQNDSWKMKNSVVSFWRRWEICSLHTMSIF